MKILEIIHLSLTALLKGYRLVGHSVWVEAGQLTDRSASVQIW